MEPLRVIASRHLIEHAPWMTVRRDTVDLGDGEAGERYVIEQPAWVNVVALTPHDDVVLVRQYRHGIRATHLEIPGGYAESPDPLSDARRELLEETGYSGGRWRPLMRVAPNPALQNNWLHTFFAEGVEETAAQSLDPQEELTVELRPLHALPSMIRDGEIVHGLHIAPLLAALRERGV